MFNVANKFREMGCVTVVGGDFNVSVGNNLDLTSNDAHVSNGGKILISLAEEFEMTLVNKLHTGRQITHVDRSSGTDRTLDYVFISKEHFDLVQSFSIDNDMSTITPYRLTGSVNNVTRKYTDHCGMLLNLKLKINKSVQDEVIKNNKVRVWKTTPESEALFSCLTDDGANKLLEMVADDSMDINKLLKRVDNFIKC